MASRERKVGFRITMKGKCQRGFAGMSTGPRVVKQRLQAPLILLDDPPAFSIESCVWITPQPRLKRPNLQIPDRLRRYSAQPDVCRSDRLLLLVRTCQRETVVMRQTCGVLCFAARLGTHHRMGANRINRVCGFDKQSASPPGGAGGVAGSASGFLVHPSQPGWDNW